MQISPERAEEIIARHIDRLFVGMEVLDPGVDVLVVTENGYGKRTHESEYRIQTRGGKGLKTCNITPKNGSVVSVKAVRGDEDLMIITGNGVLIRMDVNDISSMGRNTVGVKLIKLDENEHVSTVALVEKEEQEEQHEEE